MARAPHQIRGRHGVHDHVCPCAADPDHRSDDPHPGVGDHLTCAADPTTNADDHLQPADDPRPSAGSRRCHERTPTRCDPGPNAASGVDRLRTAHLACAWRNARHRCGGCPNGSTWVCGHPIGRHSSDANPNPSDANPNQRNESPNRYQQPAPASLPQIRDREVHRHQPRDAQNPGAHHRSPAAHWTDDHSGDARRVPLILWTPEPSRPPRFVPRMRKGPPVWMALCERLSGGVLLSHAVARAVPSALRGLASRFGMELGVSLSPWPPKLY